MSPPLAIETRRLTRRYGNRIAVDSLDLCVAEGSVFGFLGPNGAGKSTTLRLLCGQIEPSEGEAIVGGLHASREQRRLQRIIGFMPQSFGLYGYLTVRENLDFYADLYLDSRAEVRTRVSEIVELTGLGERLGQAADSLSGGWKQRLALGCAILHRPRILFLDEPTAGVDAVSRRLFWDLLFRLNEQGTTLFVTTHYMEELERCGEVGILAAGQLRAVGPPRALKAQVAERFELISVISEERDRALQVTRRLPGVCDSYMFGDELRLTFEKGTSALLRVVGALREAKVPVSEVDERPPEMEDVLVASQKAKQ